METIGIDIGSSYVAIVKTENSKSEAILYKPHRGNYKEVLSSLSLPEEKIVYTGINSYKLGGYHPFFSLISYSRLFQSVRHIIYVGASSYFIINLDDRGNYINHISNTTCASGTGSFLDLQARRLGYTALELGEKALKAKVSPAISTRCSVFAKTDLIHLQQEGYTKEEIASGLCKSIAENIIDNLFKGAKPAGNILFAGGVFQNKALLQAFKNRLEETSFYCDQPHLALATGASLIDRKTANKGASFHVFLEDEKNTIRTEKIPLKTSNYPDFSAFIYRVDEKQNEITIYEDSLLKSARKQTLSVFMGIDIGSTSTKICLIDSNQKVILSVYRKTASDPIGACKLIFEALRSIEKENELTFKFNGVATTGSGRKMIKEVISADDAINEITAHAIAAAFIDKDVDTIIEIGGQDAKFTRLRNGIVTYSVMNYVCAAGTGSFIEEQAEKLGIGINDFADIAVNRTPPPTSDRCTVFMEKDIDLLVAAGVSKEDIAAAVLISVRDNYLNKVVGNVPMGNKIYFQGATARNRSLVAAFEMRLGQQIYVSPYCHITGALGCALHIREKNLAKSAFCGLSFCEKKTEIRKEECPLCVNKCALSIIATENDKVAWGMKCGRDYKDATPKKHHKNIFIAERDKELTKTEFYPKGKIYLPDFLANAEKLDFVHTLLTEIGIEPVVIKPQKSDYVEGRKRVLHEICAPCVITFGAISKLNELPVFMPHFLRNNVPQGLSECHLCPLTQAMPSVLKTLFPEKTFLSPKIFEHLPYDRQAIEIYNSLKQHYDVHLDDVKQALEKAYNIRELLKQKKYKVGKQFLEDLKEDDIATVVIGRPYILYNNHLNHKLIDTLEDYGVKALPVNYLEVDYEFLRNYFPHMYWNYGQIILSALKNISEKRTLFPIMFTCFSCGPDSFILNYFYKEMEALKKPYLALQLDGHSAATGYLTRIEAAIDSFKNYLSLDIEGKLSRTTYKVPDGKMNGKKVLIPPMDIEGARLVASSFKREGWDAEVLHESSISFKEGLKHSLGHECSPFHSTLGAVVQKLRNNGKESLAYFMPTGTGPCRFGQYSVLQDVVLKKLNLNTDIVAPSGENAYSGLPLKLRMTFFDTIIINDILRKIVLITRPYEVKKGETDALYEEILQKLSDTIANKGDYINTYKASLEKFSKIKTEKVKKPKIGIVGEIYVRNNAFLNDQLIKTVELLGAEASISSFSEWFFYTLYSERLEKRLKLNGNHGILERLRLFIKNSYYNQREHFLYKLAKEYFPIFEPPIEDVMEKGARYLPMEFQGEAILTIGRAIIFFEQEGVDAVVNASPTFCMPGTLSSYLLKALEKQYKRPAINLFYDKTGKPNMELVPYLELIKTKI